jgi:putative addiction module component (TIGR02574 family)
MSIEQVLENLKDLSSNEKAMLAHCLIASLDKDQEEGIEDAWGRLAEQRLQELKSGKVKGMSWDALKEDIRG